MEFLGRYNPLRSRITGLRRTDFRAYPDYALREALTNAVVHRDYSVDSHTLVSVFDDGISIASYGGLKRGLGIDDIMIGMSSPRNPRNASIFYRLGFIEAYGTGIPRMMDDYSDALVKSTIVHSTNVFKVELPEMCPSVSEQSSIDAVLRFAETHEIFTRAEVEDVLKGFRYRAGIILSAMVDEGLLERIGNGRATRYMLSRK